MTAAFGTIGRTAYGSRSNTSTTLPTGTADGDLLILLAVTGNATQVPVTLPGAFTAMGSAQSGADAGGFDWYCVMGYRVASSEPGSYACTHATANCETIMVRITGTATLSVDTFSQGTHTIESGTSTAPAVTTTATDDLLIFLSMNWDVVALAPPAGMTERQDAQFLYLATEALSLSGATGDRTQTHANSPWFANLVAVKDVASSTNTIMFADQARLGG